MVALPRRTVRSPFWRIWTPQHVTLDACLMCDDADGPVCQLGVRIVGRRRRPLVMKWYDLGWVEWLNVVGFVITIVGFAFAFWQILKTRSAAEAAGQAAVITQRQLASNQLLILIPQLRWLSGELDAAIEADDAQLARRHLDSWRWQASHVHGLLIDDRSIQRRLLRDLQESVSLAFSGITSLMDGKRPVLEACRQARESIGVACNELSTWVGQQSAQAQGVIE